MKLWVDDERPAPEGWTWAKTVDEATQALTDNEVTDLSLDYSLANWEDGAMVLAWLDNHLDRYPTATVVPHSGSASGYDLLERVIADTEVRVRGYREIVGTPAWHLAEALHEESRKHDEPSWGSIGTMRQVDRANSAKRALKRVGELPYRWAGPEGAPTDASGSVLTASLDGESRA